MNVPVIDIVTSTNLKTNLSYIMNIPVTYIVTSTKSQNKFNLHQECIVTDVVTSTDLKTNVSYIKNVPITDIATSDFKTCSAVFICHECPSYQYIHK